jgi:hypothetical protein
MQLWDEHRSLDVAYHSDKPHRIGPRPIRDLLPSGGGEGNKGRGFVSSLRFFLTNWPAVKGEIGPLSAFNGMRRITNRIAIDRSVYELLVQYGSCMDRISVRKKSILPYLLPEKWLKTLVVRAKLQLLVSLRC